MEITIFEKSDGILSKRIHLDERGKVVSDGSACFMAHGEAKRLSIASLDVLAHAVNRLTQKQALALGRLRRDLPDEVEIVSLRRVNGTPNAVARTLSNIVFAEGEPAIALLDYDRKGMPREVEQRIDQLGGFWKALVSVAPALKRAGRVTRASTSAGLYRVDNKERFAGSGGLHVYIIVRDGADIPRFLRALHERCLVAGLGWCLVGASGSLLERSIVDPSVASPERLVFEGAPRLLPPLAQDREARAARGTPGGTVETAECPDLDSAARAALDRWRAGEAERHRQDCRRAREAWCVATAHALIERGATPEAARKCAERQCDKNVLLPPVVLPFDDPELAGKTVGDVLVADQAQFEGATLADPLEGPSYGRGKAKVLLRDGGEAVIHSFAHGGGRLFELRHDAASIKAALDGATKEDVAAVYVRMRAVAELDAGEVETLAKHAAKKADIGIKTLRSMEFEARKEAARGDAERANERARARDDRVSLPRPLHDDEQPPVIVAIDEALTAQEGAIPPMRGAEGVPIDARPRRPALLHEVLEPDDGE